MTEPTLDKLTKAAQKEADSLSKEQIQSIIKATREAELEALKAAQRYYEDLAAKFGANILHNGPTPQKLNDVNSILKSIAITHISFLET
jgi:hypothetical protein